MKGYLFLCSALLSALFLSCASKAVLSKPEQALTDTAYRLPVSDYIAPDTVTIGALAWRDFYDDVHLRMLINEALQSSTRMQTALYRIEQAEETARVSMEQFFPSLDFAAEIRLRKDLNRSPTKIYHGLFYFNWEIDVWGRLRHTRRAKIKRLEQSVINRWAVQSMLIAQIAEQYYKLVVYRAKRDALKETVTRNKEVVEYWQSQQSEMLTITELSSHSYHEQSVAVEQAKSEWYSADAKLSSVEAEIFIAENLLNTLLNRSSGELTLTSIEELYASPVFRDTLQIGYPAQLLRYRPDVMKAEAALGEYLELNKAARAEFYPKVALSGNIGFENNLFKSWFDVPASFVGSFLGGLTFPLFHRRAIRSQYKLSTLEHEIAFLNFRETLLNAQCEVSNTLMRCIMSMRQTESYYLSYLAERSAYEQSRSLLARNKISSYDFVLSQNRYINAQISFYDSLLNTFLQRVAVYRSLGGGWQN